MYKIKFHKGGVMNKLISVCFITLIMNSQIYANGGGKCSHKFSDGSHKCSNSEIWDYDTCSCKGFSSNYNYNPNIPGQIYVPPNPYTPYMFPGIY
jgi:hypothetical protein